MKIALNPGHGGNDPGAPGAVASLPPEKDLALDTCMAAEKVLHGYGHDVYMNRVDDVFHSLPEIASYANKAGADVFVSVHYNSHRPHVTGVETFYYQSGRELAEHLQELIVPAYNGIPLPNGTAFSHADRGPKQKGYSVLRRTRMPAILHEVEFISNKRMHEWAAENTEEIGIALGEALHKVISEFFGIKEPPATPEPQLEDDAWTKTLSNIRYLLDYRDHYPRADLARRLQWQANKLAQGTDMGSGISQPGWARL